MLNTERLKLISLSYKELDTGYINWLNDKEVCKYNSHGDELYTREMAQDYINSIQNDLTCEVYAVYEKDKNIHIGNISLQHIDKKNKSAEIAYLFGEKEYWGNGYATEASKVLLKRACETLNIHRIYFGTHIENKAMQKVGEKLGFKKEGILKDAQYKDGKFNDIVCYALIKEG